MEPKDQGSSVVDGGSGVLSTTSGVNHVENLGLGGKVNSEITSVDLALIRDIYTSENEPLREYILAPVVFKTVDSG